MLTPETMRVADNIALGRRLTIGISSFERPGALFRLLDSISRYYPDVPVLVADDSSPTTQDGLDYVLAPAEGWAASYPMVRLLPQEYDCGLSVKRNALVAACETELFCLCDDDFVFTEQTNLQLLVDALDAGLDLAAGSVGATYAYCHRFVRRGSVMFEEPVRLTDPDLTTFAGYPLYDLLLNFFVARTAAIRAVPWDPPLKMHEHGDWFLRLPHLKKTLVPECLVDHVRESPGDYGDHRAYKVVSCLGTRMERLIARGLTHYVSDDGRILVVEKERAAAPGRAAKELALREDRGPMTVRVAAANHVGPSIGTKGESLKPAPRPVAPKPVVLPPPVKRLTVADLPTTAMFLGLATGTRVSPLAADLDSPWDAEDFAQARVLVVGSAPVAVLPPRESYDVIVVANGGIAHVPPENTAPVIAVLVDAVLGLITDQHGTHRAALAAYAGRQVLRVVVHSGAWSDYHDGLSATWYRRQDSDLAALGLADDVCEPWGLTPAGRDRILAIDGQLIHGARRDQPNTWPWGVGGWSTGIVAVALARAYGAASITLAGISFDQTGHVHAEYDSDGRRAHQLGDLCWLQAVAATNPGLLASTDGTLGRLVGIPVILPADAPVSGA